MAARDEGEIPCDVCGRAPQTGIYINPSGCFCGVQTIGYGHTVPPSTDRPLTQVEAGQKLAADLARASAAARQRSQPIVTDCQHVPPAEAYHPPWWLAVLGIFLACSALLVWSLTTFRLGFSLGWLVGYLTPGTPL